MWAKIKNFKVSPKFVKGFVVYLIIMGLIHHTDHALRFDHSGWPLRPLVTPFTFTLLVYPVLATFFFVKNKAYRITMSLILLLVVWGTHLIIELPEHIYRTWADNRVPDGIYAGHANLLHVASPALGILSVTQLGILAISLFALPVLIWHERSDDSKKKPTRRSVRN